MGGGASSNKQAVIAAYHTDPKNFEKCRTTVPPFYKIDDQVVERTVVPDDKISWSVNYPEYEPTDITLKVVHDNDICINPKGWADPNDVDKKKPNDKTVKEELLLSAERVNKLGVNKAAELNASENMKLRFSHTGEIKYHETTGRPLFPMGRIGLTGRGSLGNWGPNHAADPVVVRFNKNSETGEKSLQFILVKRKDNGQWALPGGIVEAGQNIADTRTREFAEEALNSMQKEDETKEEHAERVKELQQVLNKIFANSVMEDDTLYKGVVDDPRNTDHSWMETVALLTVLGDDIADQLPLEAGDDAGKVKWKDYSYLMSKKVELFASHAKIVALAIECLVSRGLIDAAGNVL